MPAPQPFAARKSLQLAATRTESTYRRSRNVLFYNDFCLTWYYSSNLYAGKVVYILKRIQLTLNLQKKKKSFYY